jgi:oxalate---CoA ligase
MPDTEHLCVRDLLINGVRNPNTPAIESPGFEPLSYRDLCRQVAYVVKYLNAQGFLPNDRIALILPRGPYAAVATIAVMAGFTVVPLNYQYRVPEYDGYFTSLHISAVIVEKDTAPDAVEAAGNRAIPVIGLIRSQKTAGMFTLVPETDCRETDARYAGSGDIIALTQTSGTTARPKIIPVTQKFLFSVTRKLNGLFGLTVSDRHLHILPLDSAFGIFSPLWGPLLEGGTVIVPGDFIPPDFFGILKTCRPTYYWGVPALHAAIARELKKIPMEELGDHSLRFIATASAVMNPSVIRSLEDLLDVPVIEEYGMTEAPCIAMNRTGRTGSVGQPIIDQLGIWDDSDHPVPAGETGEVVLRGDLVFPGYLDAPEENAAVFRNGWFRTGDTGYLDPDGYLFLTGRKKDLINKGGRKIAPAEIDLTLMSHPGVVDAMAFAIRDPVLGEEVAAMVVPGRVGVTEQDLRTYLLDRLAPFKVPRRIYVADSIPRTHTGKPVRSEGTLRYSQKEQR